MRIYSKGLWALTLAVLTACAPGRGGSENVERSVGERRYVLVDPAGVSGPAPIVLALHGGFGDADRFQAQLPLAAQAGAQGFRVAYLEGMGAGRLGRRARSWNAGTCCGPAQRNGVNDVAYIDGVVAQLRGEGLLSEVYMVGHSNGAMMIYRYMCEGSAPVAGAAIISGANMTGGCGRSTGGRALLVHGAEDDNVPVAGGRGAGVADVAFTPLQQSADALRAGGTRVQVEVVPGAGHSMRSIDSAVRAQTGRGLPDYVTGFLFGS